MLAVQNYGIHTILTCLDDRNPIKLHDTEKLISFYGVTFAFGWFLRFILPIFKARYADG